MSAYKKIPLILAIIAVALASIVKLTPITTDVEMHKHSIEQIDKEVDSVLKLTAGATAASAGISLLPDDSCTPIAQQFAELAKYFLIVLSALYLEKYLITLMGYVSFAFIVPLACALLCGGIILNREKVRSLSYRLLITSIAVYLAIPFSVKVSETIYNTYESTINQTISSAERISVAEEDDSTIDKFVSWIKDAAGTVVDYVTGLLSRFVEAVAVMLVTSCLIPILVIIFFAWLVKVFFKVDFSLSDAERLIKKREKKLLEDSEEQ